MKDFTNESVLLVEMSLVFPPSSTYNRSKQATHISINYRCHEFYTLSYNLGRFIENLFANISTDLINQQVKIIQSKFSVYKKVLPKKGQMHKRCFDLE
jgi:hypothetical protein